MNILEHRLAKSSLRSALANEASLNANRKALKASQDSLTTLEGIAFRGRLEQKVGQESSANVQALTTVATLYLPASLLAVCGSHLLPLLGFMTNFDRASSARSSWSFELITLSPQLNSGSIL